MNATATATAMPTLSTEEQGFLAAIAADPADTTLRLIYADWLEERGRTEDAQAQRSYPEGTTVEIVGAWKITREGRGGKVWARADRLASKARFPKPAWCYRFGSLERRERFIADWKASQERQAQARAGRVEAQRQARANFVNPYTAGQVFYTSWGYDQTNIDWYQAVKIGPRSVTLQRIGGNLVETGHMSGTTTPRPGHYLADHQPICVTVQLAVDRDGTVRPYLPAAHSSYYPWDGQSKCCSWYH